MAERKFSALADLKKRQNSGAEAVVVPTAEPPIAMRGRGRPAGKRSDPDYEPTTLLLRKGTKKAAFRLLDDLESGQDLSDLTEQLISNWIRERQV